MPSKSTQAVGIENAKKLEDWVNVTLNRNVPRNSDGKSSKRAICKMLGITKSTIGTNVTLCKIFEYLDSRISGSDFISPRQASVDIIPGPSSAEFIRLLDSLQNAQAELARLSHLSDTGKWIPKS